MSSNLGFMLQDLTTAIQRAIASVYDLGAAAITSVQPAEEAQNLQNPLREHWNKIRSILEQCYDAIDSLLTLIQSIGVEPDQQCLAFFDEIMVLVTTIQERFRSVIVQNSEIWKRFDAARFGLGSSTRTTVHESVNLPVEPEVYSDAGRLHPNGADSAIESTPFYLACIKSHLDTILQYWIELYEKCQSVLEPPIPSREVLEERCKSCAALWQTDRNHIRVALISLNRSIGSITIEARNTTAPAVDLSLGTRPNPLCQDVPSARVSPAPISTSAPSTLQAMIKVPTPLYSPLSEIDTNLVLVEYSSLSALPTHIPPSMSKSSNPQNTTTTTEPTDTRMSWRERPLPPIPLPSLSDSQSKSSKAEEVKHRISSYWKGLFSSKYQLDKQKALALAHFCGIESPGVSWEISNDIVFPWS